MHNRYHNIPSYHYSRLPFGDVTFMFVCDDRLLKSCADGPILGIINSVNHVHAPLRTRDSEHKYWPCDHEPTKNRLSSPLRYWPFSVKPRNLILWLHIKPATVSAFLDHHTPITLGFPLSVTYASFSTLFLFSWELVIFITEIFSS